MTFPCLATAIDSQGKSNLCLNCSHVLGSVHLTTLAPLGAGLVRETSQTWSSFRLKAVWSGLPVHVGLWWFHFGCPFIAFFGWGAVNTLRAEEDGKPGLWLVFKQQLFTWGVSVLTGSSWAWTAWCQLLCLKEASVSCSATETLYLFSSHFNAVDDLWFHAEKHTECLHSHVCEEVCFPFVTRVHHLGDCLDDYLLTMRYWLWSGIASLYLPYGHNHEVFSQFFLIPQYLAKC